MKTTLVWIGIFFLCWSTTHAQKLEIGYRFGASQSLINFDFSGQKTFQAYADFYNFNTTITSIDISYDLLDILFYGLTVNYHFKNDYLLLGSINYGTLKGSADIKITDDITFTDGGITSEIAAFSINNSSISLNFGRKFSRTTNVIPILYGGVTYTRNWRLKNTFLANNSYSTSLRNFASLSANILSLNVGFNMNFFENTLFSLEVQRSITPIDIDQENPFFVSMTNVLTTLTIPLIHINPNSKKYKKILKNRNRGF